MPEWKQEIRRRLANLKLDPAREVVIVEELEQHLADYYAEALAGGATEAEAYRRSLGELQNSEMLWRQLRRSERESHSEGSIRRRNVIADLWQDVRFGCRMLLKQPGFTLIAVITLALGIGANTAIFSVIYAVLLRPLPYPAADRLVLLTATGTNVDLPTYVSYPDYVDWRDRTHSFDDSACFVDDVFNVTGIDSAIAVDGRRVNWNFFQMLGVKPQVGRLFAPSDDQAGAVPTATISDALWHEKFGGDNAVIGKTIILDGSSYAVIGVLPPGFQLDRHDDVFVPLGLWFVPGHNLLKRDNQSSHALARLKAGVTLTQARADLAVVAAQLEHEYPQTNRGRSASAERLSDLLVKDVRPVLLVLLTAVGCVLLIACVNVTNLMLVRAAGRETELSVRLALGARTGRIIQQMLTESMLIAALGGLAGLLLGAWAISSLSRLIPGTLVKLDQITLNIPVLLFTLGISLLTGLLFGLLPALRTARTHPNVSLKQGGRLIGRSGWAKACNSLLVAEVSLALVLLVGAGLMLRTLQQLTRVDLGFDATNLLTLRSQLSNDVYNDERRLTFFRECRMRLEALPGVRSASFVMSLPLQGASWNL